MKFLNLFGLLVLLYSCNSDSTSPSKNSKQSKKLVAKENVKTYIDPVPTFELDETYEFLNAAIFVDSVNPINISRNVSSFLLKRESKEELASKFGISKSDLNYIANNIDSNQYYWNCAKIEFVDCIDEVVLDSIFDANEYKRIAEKLKENNDGTVSYSYSDPWQEIESKYGEGGIRFYSLPIFNESKNIALIRCTTRAHFDAASSVIIVYQKDKKGNWKEIGHSKIWTSW